MDAHVLDALVDGYEHRIEGLALPDPDDRHVLAAAIECRASLIVTWNTKHFPVDYLKPFGIIAVNPDEFLLDQLDLSVDLVLLAVKRHKDSLKYPALTWSEYFQNLEKQGLTESVQHLRELIPESKTSVETLGQ